MAGTTSTLLPAQTLIWNALHTAENGASKREGLPETEMAPKELPTAHSYVRRRSFTVEQSQRHRGSSHPINATNFFTGTRRSSPTGFRGPSIGEHEGRWHSSVLSLFVLTSDMQLLFYGPGCLALVSRGCGQVHIVTRNRSGAVEKPISPVEAHNPAMAVMATVAMR
jgi:hypothetical protein